MGEGSLPSGTFGIWIPPGQTIPWPLGHSEGQGVYTLWDRVVINLASPQSPLPGWFSRFLLSVLTAPGEIYQPGSAAAAEAANS